MAKDDPSPLRRSGRDRKKPTSEYDQELAAIAEKMQAKRALQDESS